MEKKTEFGTIKIADYMFERIIKEGLALTNGKAMLALEMKNIYIDEHRDFLRIEFHVVHKFGSSIRSTSKTVFDYMEKMIKPLNVGKPVRIHMIIVAVKSRRIVKRDIEIMREIG